MLLSERKNKRYVIVLDQYDENLGRYIPKSHTHVYHVAMTPPATRSATYTCSNHGTPA